VFRFVIVPADYAYIVDMQSSHHRDRCSWLLSELPSSSSLRCALLILIESFSFLMNTPGDFFFFFFVSVSSSSA
jgi:hypothetical protein